VTRLRLTSTAIVDEGALSSELVFGSSLDQFPHSFDFIHTWPVPPSGLCAG
jgi:hypothetical protein